MTPFLSQYCLSRLGITSAGVKGTEHMKVAFAGSFAARLVEPVRKQLKPCCEIVTGDEIAILQELRDAEVLVSMGFDAAMASAAPRLRLVQVPGAGLDRIDRSQLRSGLALANAYGHEAGIAEYIIGAMIALTRSFSRIDQKLRVGQWESQWSVGNPAPPLWSELTGKTLGILGFGHIGEALARRAQAFDMKVCAVRRQAQPKAPAGLTFIGGPERMDDVLRSSDYLAITLALSPDTRGLLDRRRLNHEVNSLSDQRSARRDHR
jgi:phosphoglycerate dehydrogenase-like enzyme